MQTVIGAFDDRATAQSAVQRLIDAGFDRDDVHVEQEDMTSATQGSVSDRDAEATSGDERSGIRGFFYHLFGGDDDRSGLSTHYVEAVRRGGSVVVVDAQSEPEAERAAALLNELGAIDVNERAQQWRAGGWTGTESTVSDPAPAATGMSDQDLQSRGPSSRDSLKNGQEGVLNVVQEELQVGKRTLDQGGVRVIQRVSERPVREIVRLREERATVERRPVNRPATAEDMSNFREGTLEVRESSEEAVVGKSARVVEEVRVGKQVGEREQAIEDTVRRRDVDVERMAGDAGRERSSERERSVAADPAGQSPLTEGDRTLRKPTTQGKDKPTR